MLTTRCPTCGQTRHEPRDPLALAQREQQVVDLVAEGHNYETVAGMLGISKHTVNGHIVSIFEKCDVHSRTELVLWAWKRRAAGKR